MQTAVSIVTGSAQGIGKAISLSLAKNGAKLTLVDIDEQKLKRAGREIEKADYITGEILDVNGGLLMD